MKVLIQRVSHAKVVVGDETVGEIDRGLLAFVGISRDDDESVVERLAERVLNYRVFADAEGRMNQSLLDQGLSLLVVSQFTLVADTLRGKRPSFSTAASPESAKKLYEHFIRVCCSQAKRVETGRFGADMQVSLQNDGPVTFLLEA